MEQGLWLLQRSPPLPSLPLSVLVRSMRRLPLVRATALATLEPSPAGGGHLSARERRQLRNERRESRAGSGNWREEVEERLMRKPKKQHVSWTEKLNLDNLARLGPQWWVVRVSRVTGHETTERLARSIIRNFPDIEFKVYHPAVKEKRKLKNGSYSIKLKPLFPGCVFLHCIMNKEIHDFIRECDGIGGFLGSKVGNTKRQINKPKPVAADEMEAIFRQAREEQEKADKVFPEGQQGTNFDAYMDSADSIKSVSDTKHARAIRKGSEPSKRRLVSGENSKSLAPGVSVRVLSGPFSEFTGHLKKLDLKTGKATVGFLLFGKESFVDLEVDQIVADTT